MTDGQLQGEQADALRDRVQALEADYAAARAEEARLRQRRGELLLAQDLAERPGRLERSFWRRVDRSGGGDACWLWTGRLDATGYGDTVVRGTRWKAHVLSWALAHGRLPEPGLVLRHLCNERRCTNPAHLAEGSHAENNADRLARERGEASVLPTGVEAPPPVAWVAPDPAELERVIADHATARDRVARLREERLEASMELERAETPPGEETPTEGYFLARVDRSGGPDACWPWTGHVNAGGYGSAEAWGARWAASRLAWTLANGRPVPAGLVVRHSCDNPICCNAKHLTLGTQAENAADRDTRGRRRTRTSRGEDNGQCAMTPDEVLRARRLRAVGWTYEAIAEELGKPERTVRNAVTGRTWAHLPGAVPSQGLRRGEANPASRLTEAQVRWILAQDAGVSDAELARQLGVGTTTVRAVRRRRTWAWVDVDPSPAAEIELG